MQISKTYQGEVTLEAERVKRDRAYGIEGATQIEVYPSKVDILNQIIAQFLRNECGVDATYTYGTQSEWPFLWIYGVPFLFAPVGSSNAINFYYLYNPEGSIAGYVGGPTLFSGNKYAFKLSFVGNPNTCFCLRFNQYSDTTGNTTSYYNLPFVFAKAQNIINGNDSVLWRPVLRGYTAVYLSSNRYAYYGPTHLGFYAMDLGSRYQVRIETIPTASVAYCPSLFTIKEHMTANEGSLPLVPLMVGPYRVNGVYLRPMNYNLPVAAASTVEVQEEITIGRRSFLITNPDSPSSSYINMGLIETT